MKGLLVRWAWASPLKFYCLEKPLGSCCKQKSSFSESLESTGCRSREMLRWIKAFHYENGKQWSNKDKGNVYYVASGKTLMTEK